jgi:hypothetical protein
MVLLGRRNTVPRMVGGALVLLLLLGCTDATNLLNPDFAALLGVTKSAASLPGDAPGLLVSVENRTSRWISVRISYRNVDNDAKQYETLVAPNSKSGQMLTCPVPEITMGDVGSTAALGARVYLVDPGTADLTTVPYIDVEAFGVLMKAGINYDCGDALLFAVQPSSDTRSGYRAFAYIRRASTSS